MDLEEIFGEKELELAQWILDLQKKLINLDSKSVDDVASWASETGGAENLTMVVRMILKAAVVRQNSLDALCDLFIALTEKLQARTKMLDLLMTKFLLNAERFILFLLRKRFIDPENVMIKIKPLLESGDDFYEYISLFAFFAPEIEAVCPEQMEKFVLSIPTMMKSDRLSTYEKLFLRAFPFFREDKWNTLNERRFNSFEPGSLEYLIMIDDVESLHSVIDNEDFDVDMVIPHTIHTSTVFPLCDPTLAQFCALHGAVNCLKLLIKHSCNLEKNNEHNATVAHFAVAGGHPEILQLVRELKLNVFEAPQAAIKFFRNDLFMEYFDQSSLDEFGRCFDTILNCAVTEMNMEVLLYIFEHDCDINQKGTYGYRALHCSLMYAPPEMTSFLLSHCDLDINAETDAGESPVFFATQVDEVDSLEKILEHDGFRPKDDDIGRTPLHIACHSNCAKALTTLLHSNKYDINEIDIAHRTPLHIAVLNKATECVHILCEHDGINLEAKDMRGDTPLDIAKSLHLNDIAEYIESQLDETSTYSESSE